MFSKIQISVKYITVNFVICTTCTVHSESRCALIKSDGTLEVMSTSVYTGLSPFNFIRKHFLQICFWDVSYVCSFSFIKLVWAITIHRSLSAQQLSDCTVYRVIHKYLRDFRT